MIPLIQSLTVQTKHEIMLLLKVTLIFFSDSPRKQTSKTFYEKHHTTLHALNFIKQN